MSNSDFIDLCQMAIVLMFFAWLTSVERALGRLTKYADKRGAELMHLENEHVRLDRRVGRLERAPFEAKPKDDADEERGDGPYRSADHFPDAGGMVGDEEPGPLVSGQEVDVRIDGSVWFRATFHGLITLDACTPFARIACGTTQPETFALTRIEMRHARAS